MQLKKLYPTAAEQKLIAKVIKDRLTNPNENITEKTRLVWDKPETLFIALGKIPSCPLRLTCWAAQLEYEERIADTLPPVECLINACSELRSSIRWKLIMGTILAIGNYMNGGTKRGQADGFKMDGLLKLESTKLLPILDSDLEENESLEGLKTLLDLVSHQCWCVDKEIGTILINELVSLKKATKIDIVDLKSKCSKLSSDIVRLDGNYKRVVETTNNMNDPFNTEISNFLVAAKKASSTITTEMRKLDKDYLEAVLFLTGFDEKKASKIKSESFFNGIFTFLEKLIKAIPKVVKDENNKERRNTRKENRKFGLGQKIVRRGIMEGVKIGVKLKKTTGPQKHKKINSGGSALAQIMSKSMKSRRGQIIDSKSATAENFGDSDEDWDSD